MATLWRQSGMRAFDVNGALAGGAKVRFFVGNTTTPLTVYQDSALTTPHPAEVSADAFGLWPAIYLPYEDHDEQAMTAAGAQLWYFRGISNPAPSSGGGGGGGTVTADQAFQTGDVLWLPRSGLRASWVRANGRTIGSAGSGATERANADTAALFADLWNNYANVVCPVSGGRGASAAADYAASKTIGLPDLRGRAAVGLDDMGNSAANRIQISTTISTTTGSATATAASAADLAIGMKVAATSVPTGTTVNNISGTTLTLSANATATASGAAARFSLFDDAQSPALGAGLQTHTQHLRELAQHDHGGNTGSGGAATLTYEKAALSNSATTGSTQNVRVNAETGTLNVPAHAHTIPNAGNSLPMPNLQPSMLGTFYIKL
jgi:hypothetical protein